MLDDGRHARPAFDAPSALPTAGTAPGRHRRRSHDRSPRGSAAGDRDRRTRAAAMTGRVLAELVAAVAPPACVACRAALATAGEALCAPCRRALPWLRGPRCPRCALPRHGSRACPAARAGFDAAWAPLAYDATS